MRTLQQDSSQDGSIICSTQCCSVCGQMQLNMFGRCKSTHSAGNQQRHVCCAAGNANNSSSEPSQVSYTYCSYGIAAATSPIYILLLLCTAAVHKFCQCTQVLSGCAVRLCRLLKTAHLHALCRSHQVTTATEVGWSLTASAGTPTGVTATAATCASISSCAA